MVSLESRMSSFKNSNILFKESTQVTPRELQKVIIESYDTKNEQYLLKKNVIEIIK